MSKYKVIQKGQFATNSAMHVNRDEILPVPYTQKTSLPLYHLPISLLKVIDERELLPEYLMMGFKDLNLTERLGLL